MAAASAVEEKLYTLRQVNVSDDCKGYGIYNVDLVCKEDGDADNDDFFKHYKQNNYD